MINRSTIYFLRYYKISVALALLLLIIGCDKDIPIINRSETYSVCNDRLIACTGSRAGEYCLFGYKWGVNQNFDEVGIDANGPQTTGGTLTFSFYGSGHLINTHKQANVPSESWGEILGCAQDKVRKAISEWQEVVNINFEELPSNTESDIKFYVAAILQSAVGYPNYQETPCNILNGDVIFDANSNEKSCNGYYINALHEIGHVLGLGHVSSDNIMTTDGSKFSMNGLQSGDIAGGQQIYGEK